MHLCRLHFVMATSLLLALVGPSYGDKPSMQENPARTDQYGDPLPDGAVQRLGSLRLQHGGQIFSVAYSPDGKLLASGGNDKAVRLWDPATGKQVRKIDVKGVKAE